MIRRRSLRARAAVATLLAALLQGLGHRAQAADPALEEAYRERDFFTLRELVTGAEAGGSAPELLFYRAVVEHAFNRPASSNQRLDELLASGALAAERLAEVHRLRMANALRRHDYSGGLAAARAALAAAGPGDANRAEIENTARLLAALGDVPPQTASVERPSRVRLIDGRVPLEIAGQKRRFALDTGANLSVIMRSEAEQLGLVTRPAGIDVATSTGRRMAADVAVAERVRIGNVDYRHVAFLVFPDEALTFPNGVRIPGLVGFPLIEAMGEVRFRRDGVLEIPSRPPRRSAANLALDELDPRVRVQYGREDLNCRLDTGAGETVLFEPFYRRHRELLTARGERVEVETGGVGGIERLPAIRLPRLTLTVASADVLLRDVEVYVEPLGAADRSELDCNLGRDAVERFRWYTLNFRDMALLVR